MTDVDIATLALLALLDICLLVYLRRRRAHYLRMDRMTRCLRLHIRAQLAHESVVGGRPAESRGDGALRRTA